LRTPLELRGDDVWDVVLRFREKRGLRRPWPQARLGPRFTLELTEAAHRYHAFVYPYARAPWSQPFLRVPVQPGLQSGWVPLSWRFLRILERQGLPAPPA
jgi:hypothetical protein